MNGNQLLAALTATLLLLFASGQARAQQSFQLVVHESNPVRMVSVDRASKLFLKKVSRWSDGREALPVDQADDSPIRASFSEAVHGRDVSSIESYWQKMIFSGRSTPPHEFSSDREVLEFVRSNSGAIGYVSADTDLGEGVARVEIEG